MKIPLCCLIFLKLCISCCLKNVFDEGLMVIISTEPIKDETSSFLYDEDDEELMELRMLDSSYLEDYDE
jgi:hypothetical protein